MNSEKNRDISEEKATLADHSKTDKVQGPGLEVTERSGFNSFTTYLLPCEFSPLTWPTHS